MKAENLEKQLKEFYTTNKDAKDLDVIVKSLIKEYARIQIEKDRDAVIENTPIHKRLDIIYAQHNTPINLD